MNIVNEILTAIRDAVWGVPTLILLLGTGLYYTVRLKGLQFVRFPKACKMIFEKEEGAGGDVSPFGSLCTSLAATIGTGSIVGVATALRIGGAGALFWMWVSALLGMTTKYAESLLAVKYRTKDENGNYCGGPMYYIQNGLGKKWKLLAVLFAIFGLITALLGCGTFPQMNSITEAVNGLWGIPPWFTGLVITILSGFVIIGGIKSISKVAEWVVPVMAVLYIGGSLWVLIANLGSIPSVFGQIFSSAFRPTAVAGGVWCVGRCDGFGYHGHANRYCQRHLHQRGRPWQLAYRIGLGTNQFLRQTRADFHDRCLFHHHRGLHHDRLCDPVLGTSWKQ